MEASGQVELGLYTSLASFYSNWCDTMHGSPQKCLMDTLLFLAPLLIQRKAHKVPEL